MKKIFFFSFFILGFSSLISQVIVIRELAMSFYSNEFFIGWVLFAWLFWSGIGSFFEKSFLKDPLSITHALWTSHALIGLLLPAVIVLIRSGRLILGIAPGAVPELLSGLFYSFIVLAPFCLILGFQFAVVARGWGLREAAVIPSILTGKAYFLETLGFIAGGILFSGVFVFKNEFRVAGLLALLNLILAAVMVRFFLKGKRWIFRILVAIAVLFPLWLFIHAGFLNSRTLGWHFPNEKLIESENTVHGNIAVTRIGEQYNFYQNGLLLGTGEDRLFSENLVHFPMLFHAAPKRILLIGTGFNGPLREILKHHPEEIYDVELDPRQVAIGTKYISEELRASLKQKNVKIWTGDSRAFLRQKLDPFDVVILHSPNPSTVLTNRFYTEDFFRSLSSVLKPDGIIATHLTFAANYISPELEQFSRSIYKSLNKTFPYLTLLPEDVFFILGSAEPLREDFSLLARRFQDRKIQNDFVSIPYLRYRLANDRVIQLRELLKKKSLVLENTDETPRGYFYHFIYWVSSFHPRWAQTLSALTKIPFLMILAVGFLLILGMKFFHGRKGPPAEGLAVSGMTLAGFSLMAAEVLLIYTYQVIYGDLYYRIAGLITGFMAGMGLGAWWGIRKKDIPNRLRMGGLHIALALYFILPAALWIKPFGSMFLKEIFFGISALGIGFLVGLEFPNAVRFSTSYQEGKPLHPGHIYAADLFGSSAGALLTAGFLIPVYGIFRTLLLLGSLNIGMAVLFFFGKDLGSKNV